METCEECGSWLIPAHLSAELNDPGVEPTHVFCDICDKAEHPADLTPDWNGETGCHLSCEKARAVSRADYPLVEVTLNDDVVVIVDRVVAEHIEQGWSVGESEEIADHDEGMHDEESLPGCPRCEELYD